MALCLSAHFSERGAPPTRSRWNWSFRLLATSVLISIAMVSVEFSRESGVRWHEFTVVISLCVSFAIMAVFLLAVVSRSAALRQRGQVRETATELIGLGAGELPAIMEQPTAAVPNKKGMVSRGFETLAFLQILADFSSCFALGSLLEQAAIAKDDVAHNMRPMRYGYSITAFGFLLFFGPAFVVASYNYVTAPRRYQAWGELSHGWSTAGRLRTTCTWLRDVVPRVAVGCAGGAMLLSLAYIAVGAAALADKRDIYCSQFTFNIWTSECGAHGDCSAGGCSCKDGFVGASCEHDPFAGVCGTRGSRIWPTGTCKCTGGYIGGRCQNNAGALLAFKVSGNGQLSLVSWENGTDPCVAKWKGVHCFSGIAIGLVMGPLDPVLTGDIRSLATMTQLTSLNLSGTKSFGDIEQLATLTNLTRLDLQDTTVSGNVNALSTLTRLTVLRLGETDVSGEIGRLSALTQLIELGLPKTSVSGQVGALNPALRALDLSHCPNIIGGVSGFAGLTKLAQLNVSGTGVSGSLWQLAKLTKMKELGFSATEVGGDVGQLANMTKLTSLQLDGTVTHAVTGWPLVTVDGGPVFLNASDHSGSPPLLAFKASGDGAGLESWIGNPCGNWAGVTCVGSTVTKIKLDNPDVTGIIDALTGMVQLLELHLVGRGLSGTVERLANLNQLILLSLADASVSGDLEPLSTMTHLKTLTLRNCAAVTGNVGDLRAIAPLKTLTVTRAAGVYGDVGQLGNLASCQHGNLATCQLNLEYTNVTGAVGQLATLTGLTNLRMAGVTGVSGNVRPLAAMSKLIHLELDSDMVTGWPLATVDGGRVFTSRGDHSGSSPLLAFKASGNGAGLDSWKDGGAPCRGTGNWSRVTCVGRAVTSLDLFEISGLTGDIAMLGGLTSLTRINMNGTAVGGDVGRLSGLSALTVVKLSGAAVTGDIQQLSALKCLDTLWLTDAKVSGRADALASLSTSLKDLRLDGCKDVTGTVDGMGEMDQLEGLRMPNTGVVGNIQSLNSLLKLSILWLSNTGIHGNVASVCSMASLGSLSIESTNVSGLISFSSSHWLPRLTDLRISRTGISGDISSPFWNWAPQLTTIDAAHTGLSGAIQDLGGLSHLTTLTLDSTGVSGDITQLALLTELASLGLASTHVHGNVTDLAALTKLTDLRLRNTSVTGCPLTLTTGQSVSCHN